MDWASAVARFRQTAAAAGRSPSFSEFLYARAVDAVEIGTVEVTPGGFFAWRGDAPIDFDTLQTALRVPGVRVAKWVAGPGIMTAGGSNTVGLVATFPGVLSSRFAASDAVSIAGTLAVRLAASLSNLWSKASRAGFWTADEIGRIQSAVAVGAFVVPSLSDPKPAGWTPERAEAYAALVGKFSAMVGLYNRAKFAEAAVEADAAANDARFWDSVAFWTKKAAELPGAVAGSVLSGIGGFLWRNLIFVALVLLAVWAWYNRAALMSRAAKATRVKGSA
jgi:hypothetical protein